MVTRVIIVDMPTPRLLLQLFEFCRDNASLLEEHGIISPEYFNGFIFPAHLPYPAGEALYGSAAGPSLVAHLHVLQSGHAVRPEPKTLFFCAPFSMKPQWLHRLNQGCARVFPRVERALFFCPVAQEKILEQRIPFRLSANRSAKIVHQSFFGKYRPDYEDFLRTAREDFRGSELRTMLPSPAHPELPQVLTELFTILGLDRQLAEEAALSFRPRLSFPLPREVAFFAAATNFLQPPPMPGMVHRWSSQAPHFLPETGYAASPYSLFGPEVHKEVRREFAESNAGAAAMLGLESLFPEPELEPHWEPWTGLDADTAFRIAQRLDKEFVRDLLDDFLELPEYMRTREQRIAHQALLEACATVEKPAPPRRFQVFPPKVAVLTLAYNHRDFIEQNIQSVIAQKTAFPVEHIIADDGSDDGTRDIILSYAKRYPHIVPVFQEKNSRGKGNIQAMFAMLRSPYAAMCDGDDYFTSPVKLQIQADFLDANPECALCFHPARVLYEDGSGRSRIYPPLEELPGGIRPYYDLEDLLRCNMIQTNSVMYRWRFRDGLPEWFRYDLTPGDWYWNILHAETGRIGFINKIMSVYRRHRNAVYYSAEINSRLHRSKTSVQELGFYAAVNKHFNGTYADLLGDMADGVFTDVLLYAEETGDSSAFDAITVKYPEFAAHFLASLKKIQEQTTRG